jgi:hypothetical protein
LTRTCQFKIDLDISDATVDDDEHVAVDGTPQLYGARSRVRLGENGEFNGDANLQRDPQRRSGRPRNQHRRRRPGSPRRRRTSTQLVTTDVAAEPRGDPAVRVIDAGTVSAPVGVECDLRLVVLRGPCYVALRSLVNGGGAPAGLIVLREPGRSLSERDVHDVTGVAVVATIPVSAAVARTIDAGLFIARLDRLRDLAQLRRYAADLLDLHAALSEPQNDSTSRISSAVVDGSTRGSDTLSKVGTDSPVPLRGTGRSREHARSAAATLAREAVVDHPGAVLPTGGRACEISPTRARVRPRSTTVDARR